MMYLRLLILALLLVVTGGHGHAEEETKERPLFRDFVGLCGHTVNFKPDLYWPVCRVVRDYHPVKWDLGEDSSKLPEWPFAKNRVDWSKIYGSWHAKGFKISVCLMFDEMHEEWKDLDKDAYAYAKSFAEHFGPGGKWPYVETVELGNEPGLYDDAKYRKIFEAMSRGIREGNPLMKIATCNIEVGESKRYWKGTGVLAGFEDKYDVLRIHRYAIAEQWPVWRRSYPEDPQVPFLSAIQELLHWRDEHAPDKPVWVSEFGWDSSTKKPDPKGEWSKWVDSTDEEQARWLVRSFLIFARMGIDKAFVYFFNDEDEPKLHAASGLTRNYQPKPAYHAVAWMLEALKDYRFSKVIRESLEDGYIYEFAPEKDGEPVILAVWHATKENEGHEFEWEEAGKVLKAERMSGEDGEAVGLSPSIKGSTMKIEGWGAPVFVWIQR
ncbi:hypothetical protein FEM03_09155 [Phragmitibacter flavus]|uniref:Asl1-like glycosyl hydrolase catalytic domain-containing protein n=1 Tax=Phragmitibacter flavus TaxID=2576071 RepID=A0A5R8KFI8_9BACT|nr:hypothetical protein [Phragmitibacter flavus]TLD71070.1 hypothetical protein FEM03_09155 [Phragmitibacter flavus]